MGSCTTQTLLKIYIEHILQTIFLRISESKIVLKNLSNKVFYFATETTDLEVKIK